MNERWQWRRRPRRRPRRHSIKAGRQATRTVIVDVEWRPPMMDKNGSQTDKLPLLNVNCISTTTTTTTSTTFEINPSQQTTASVDYTNGGNKLEMIMNTWASLWLPHFSSIELAYFRLLLLLSRSQRSLQTLSRTAK